MTMQVQILNKDQKRTLRVVASEDHITDVNGVQDTVNFRSFLGDIPPMSYAEFWVHKGKTLALEEME